MAQRLQVTIHLVTDNGPIYAIHLRETTGIVLTANDNLTEAQ